MKVILMVLMLLFNFQSGNKRIISVYTQSADNLYYQQQLHILNADGPGFAERNLVKKIYIQDMNNNALFKHRHIKGGFIIILTGKDGGEKLRSSKPVTLKKLYAVIDAMPMRIDEMRNK